MSTILLIMTMCIIVAVLLIAAFCIGMGISKLPMWVDFIVAAIGVVLFISALASINLRGDREIDAIKKQSKAIQ